MAKASVTRNQIPVNEQEEMTVIVLKFKGGSESLSRGFEAISQALAAAQLGGSSPVQRLTQRTRTTAHAEPEGIEQDAGGEGVEAEQFVEDVLPKAPRTSNTTARKRNNYKFDNSLDLEQGDSLKVYCNAKNPQTDHEKYLVTAAWLTEQGGRPTFRATDVFSCFRGMEWSVPKDFTQPMRTLASKKSYFESQGSGEWMLTALGLSASKVISHPN